MNDFCAWLVAHGTTCAEFAGTVILIVNVYLVTRQNIWNWPTAVIGSAFFVVVYFRAGLYSDTGLQVVYIILSFYGWYHWLFGGTNRTELPVTRTPLKEAAILLVVSLVGWMVLYSIVRRLPGTSFPLLDSALATVSLAAQWMMTRKLLESWTVWILVDIAYVVMYQKKGLILTAILYAIFLLLSVLGHYQWKRTYRLRASS